VRWILARYLCTLSGELAQLAPCPQRVTLTWLAERKAAKGKRGQPAVAAFEFNLEDELFRLQDELIVQAYRLGAYKSFYIRDPKHQLISTAPFRDRVGASCVVQHDRADTCTCAARQRRCKCLRAHLHRRFLRQPGRQRHASRLGPRPGVCQPVSLHALMRRRAILSEPGSGDPARPPDAEDRRPRRDVAGRPDHGRRRGSVGKRIRNGVLSGR